MNRVETTDLADMYFTIKLQCKVRGQGALVFFVLDLCPATKIP